MHELSLSENIIDLVVDRARVERIARVSRIVVEIGVASAIDPQTLLFCFPITAAETLADGAELVIRDIPLQARCEACHMEFAPPTLISPCPFCGSFARHIVAGREMRVVSFEGE